MLMKNCDRKLGIMDKDLFNYDETLTELGEFSRADRIDYRCTDLTHAMTICRRWFRWKWQSD